MELSNSTSNDEFTFLKQGDRIPEFSWKDEAGMPVSSGSFQAKKILVILFSSDCRHCRDNFAYLEKNFFKKKHPGLEILAAGRDCDAEELDAYRKRYPLSIKLIEDPAREIFSKFASKAVPRIYLFDESKKLILSIRGYREDQLKSMINSV